VNRWMELNRSWGNIGWCREGRRYNILKYTMNLLMNFVLLIIQVLVHKCVYNGLLKYLDSFKHF
jgi:hypothetical protein